MSAPGNLWRKVHGKIMKKPTNFSWVIDGRLAGSGIPTSVAEFEWITDRGVQAVVTMTEASLPESWTKRIRYLHVPTPDQSAPDMEDIDRAVEFIEDHSSSGRPVMVHCAAGQGRAGTILACYHIRHKGMSAREAVRHIRKLRPRSIESESQEIAISLYEKHVKNQD